MRNKGGVKLADAHGCAFVKEEKNESISFFEK